ncbi:unnamed protein product [Ilex paraguariensis]|uniref:ubiquitinyl hydrolase 1 n=1 Tax=Ilex paraguariensis TaxID=185542 RepID=A0ABC8T2K6_9AQUA
MRVGGDLGLLSSFVVVVVVVLGPVIGFFIVRRKWRHAVARREEIKRLLVFASEEAARAELEATTGSSYDYGSAAVEVSASHSRQLQYHCAVCFCPTTRRCVQCKAVRYCSGKCQIIHWRQGHKDECRPFITVHQINDVEGISNLKASKQGEIESCGNVFENEGEQHAKPVETSIDKPSSSYSSRLEVPHEKGNIADECVAYDKGANLASKITTHLSSKGFSASPTSSESSVDASAGDLNDSWRLNEHQSTNDALEKFDTNCVNSNQTKPPFSKHPHLANCVDNFISSGKFEQIKPSCIEGDNQCGSSSSSRWSVDGSHGSSFSEPSTPSSGFWDGTLDSSRFRNDPLDNSVQSSSTEAGDGNMSESHSSLSPSFALAGNAVSSVDVQGSDTKTIIPNKAQSTKLGIKEPTDRTKLPEDINKTSSKSMGSLSSSSEISAHTVVDTCCESRVLKAGEISSSKACQANPASGTGRHSLIKDALKVSRLPSLCVERPNIGLNDISCTLHVPQSKEGSLSSKGYGAHLSSSTGRHTVQSVQSVPIETAHKAATGSSEFPSPSQNARKASVRKVGDLLRVSNSSCHPLGAGSEIVGRYSNKGLFPYELFVKLYNWSKVGLHPCGLMNCGNSCYANAVLQCLAFTPPLTAYFLQGLHSKSCGKKEWCFTCEFESLVLKVKEGSSPLTPIGILSQLQNIGSHLGNGRQEDAHEFLKNAIDAMQSVCLKEAGVNASGSLEETTLIGLTFGGYLRSKIKCMKCGGKSERHERMMDLTVEIEGDIGTLEEALRQFTSTEILDGENKYQCSRCKSYEKARKKLSVLEAPNVLTIALKRFQLGKFGKLNKSIRFPEILDLAPCMSGTSDKSPVFRLYGVVVHLDVMNAAFSGHYVCYVKNIQNKWFKIDDSRVKAVELEKVLTKGAYMLFYARCSPRTPKLIRNSIIPRDPRKSKNPTSKSRSHSTGPWDVSIGTECSYLNHTGFQMIQTILEEDSSSDKSSSLFSEACSCSTDSSNRDSSSTDDYVDQIFDLGCNENSHFRNSSDSDTSSSSSSPSPLYSRHSPLPDLDCYTSKYPKASDSRIHNAESAGVDGDGLWERLASRSSKVEALNSKGSVPFLCSDSTKHRKLVSRSCRETEADRLETVSPFNNAKTRVCFRRSTRGRMD